MAVVFEIQDSSCNLGTDCYFNRWSLVLLVFWGTLFLIDWLGSLFEDLSGFLHNPHTPGLGLQGSLCGVLPTYHLKKGVTPEETELLPTPRRYIIEQ